MTQNIPKKLGEIRYFVQPNKLQTPNAPAFLPRTIRAGTVGQEQVLDFVTQEGTTITRAEGLAVFNGLVRALAHFLALGYHVKLPFADFRPTVQGRIDHRDTTLSGTDVQAGVTVSPGVALRSILKDVTVVSVDQRMDSVKVFSFQNMRDRSGTSLQAGDLCIVKGQKLSFDPAVPEERVFFVSPTNREELRVTDYAHAGNRSTTFKAPADLKAGQWNLVVRTGSAKGKPLAGNFDTPLDVA